MVRTLGILALGFVAQSALAQERAPFTGFSIGLQGGVIERRISDKIAGYRFREKDSEFAYGAFVGHDLSVGGLIAGLQAEIHGGSGPIVATIADGTFNVVDPKWGYAISARIGVPVGGKLLLFGRAGYAAERSKAMFGGPTILVLAPLPGPKWRGGMLIGAGAEVSIARRVGARIEYRHNGYANSFEAQQLLVGAAYRF